MTHRYCIRETIPGRGDALHLCPICRRETPKGEASCPGCGYTFPKQARRSSLHHDPLIRFPHCADSDTGKDLIFLS